MNKHPMVYIVTVNWNGLADTLDLLKSIYNSDYKNIKVIVIDNGSSSNELKIIKRKYSKIQPIANSSNLGFSKAYNQGIRRSTKKGAKYIFVINNDTTVDKNCVSCLVDYCENSKIKQVLAPKILYHNTNIIWSMGGKHQPITSIPRLIAKGKASSKHKITVKNPEFLTGCALFVPTSVFNKVGLFDEIFFAYHEDIDFSYRVKKSNYDLICLPKAVIWHKISQSTRQRAEKVGKTMGYLMAKNGLIFGYIHYRGFKLIYYTFAQIFIKAPLYVVLKANDTISSIYYIKGVFHGLKYLVSKNSLVKFQQNN